MPKISALPPATRAAQDDELPMHNVADGETQKATIGMIMPTGTILDFAGAAAPDGFLLCFGQTLNAVTNPEYQDLYDIIGNTFGGSSNTDFVVPDLRGRVAAGQDDMGGSSANRLTTPIDGDTLGAAGGTETHTHALSDNGFAKTYYGTGGGFGTFIATPDWTALRQIGAASAVSTTKNNGSPLGGATDSGSTVQPTIILNKIIKY